MLEHYILEIRYRELDGCLALTTLGATWVGHGPVSHDPQVPKTTEGCLENLCPQDQEPRTRRLSLADCACGGREAVDQQASPCQLRPQKGAPIVPPAPLKVLTISNVKFSGSDAEKSWAIQRVSALRSGDTASIWMKAAMSLVGTTSVTLRGTSALLSC